VWPQSGDAAIGLSPARNGVPAPVHVAVLPSPIDNVHAFPTTRSGSRLSRWRSS
jgi:hypothetical protein